MNDRILKYKLIDNIVSVVLPPDGVPEYFFQVFQNLKIKMCLRLKVVFFQCTLEQMSVSRSSGKFRIAVGRRSSFTRRERACRKKSFRKMEIKNPLQNKNLNLDKILFTSTFYKLEFTFIHKITVYLQSIYTFNSKIVSFKYII